MIIVVVLWSGGYGRKDKLCLAQKQKRNGECDQSHWQRQFLLKDYICGSTGSWSSRSPIIKWYSTDLKILPKIFFQKEKLAAPVNLRPAGWTGLGPTPISTSAPSTQPPPPSPWSSPLLGGATVGDSSVVDPSDLMSNSSLKSRKDIVENLVKPVTLTHQDWTGSGSSKNSNEEEKSFSSTSWIEALKEVGQRSREKKR